MGAMGRLLLVGDSAVGPAWLGPALLSHYVAHGKEVADAVKDVCRCRGWAQAYTWVYMDTSECHTINILDQTLSTTAIYVI